MGCGVGGPGRELARTFGSNVVGLNYNAYQIERAKKHTRKAQLDHLCSYIKVMCTTKGKSHGCQDRSSVYDHESSFSLHRVISAI